MTAATPPPPLVEASLARYHAGDAAALDDLLHHAGARLQLLARQMLRRFPRVRRWTQTDDVLQGALLRLLRAVQAVRPATARAFFGLAAEQVRRELLDLARHYYGAEGPGTHHATPNPARTGGMLACDRPDRTDEPGALAEWCELHRHIASLPAELREVMDLLYYQGLTQPVAAAVLSVTVRTVQRRWQAALLRLHGVFPGDHA